MKEKSNKHIGQIIFLSVLLLLGAIAIWVLGPPSSTYLEEEKLNETQEGSDPIRAASQEALVKRYIAAYQSRNCAEVIQSTWWIQERLAKFSLQHDGDAEHIARERSQLCEELFVADPDQDRIDILGIDDRYLLSPLSVVTILGADSGSENLDKLVLERVWVQFVYSNPQTAPRTQNGVSPIHSLIAGVNISQDKLILKGSSRGNWEIDLTSISTKW